MSQPHHDLDDAFRRVSHELRSPLVSLESYMRILLGGVGGDVSPRQEEYLNKALLAIADLGRLVEDLLEATRAQSGKLPIFPVGGPVADLVRDVVGEFESKASEAEIELTMAVEPEMPLVFADAGRVRQVLRNLVGNALKFTPTGGAIRVAAGANADQTQVRFHVRDTGRGMSPEQAERVFERLYQVSSEDASVQGGLGLGLFICRDLVERQGGRIWVHSEVGQGSSFYFTLPAVSVPGALDHLASGLQEPAAVLSLVCVDAHFEGGGLERARLEASLAEVQQTLEACTMPDRDVVLPRVDLGPGTVHRFVVLAIADEAGVQVLRGRLFRQLDRVPAVADGDLQIAIRSSVLDRSRPGRLAESIERALRSERIEATAA